MARFEAINPATGKVVDDFGDGHDTAALKTLVAAAHQAFLSFRDTELRARVEKLRRAAEILRSERDRFAERITQEMGKPIAQSRAEIDKCADTCDFYAEHGPDFLKAEPIATEARDSFVSYQPLGVVLAVMPWNFPFWQVFRFAAPTLIAGNAAVLKHAQNVPGCALAIEEVFRRAGFPENLFRTALASSDQVEALLDLDEIVAATLTGSTKAGRAVAGMCGTRLKKCVLELGGSDPYVVLADADLPEAVKTCVKSRLINSGQSCISAKRMVVVAEVYDAFVEQMVAAMGRAKVGCPMQEDTEVGPLARHDLRDALHRQVEASVQAGARCVLGGSVPSGPGAFYPASVLTHVQPGMPAYDDELFGPVASILRAKDEREAVRLANDTPFGLGAAVFTRDLARARVIAEKELSAGSCFVNALVRSDPRLPFGGIKQSGYGRELGRHGILEFTNAKTVYIA